MTRFFLLISFFLPCMHSLAQKGDYKFVVNSQEEFNSIAGEPLSHAFAGVSSVKLVYHLAEKKLYFIDSKKYPLHYNFCKETFENIEIPDFNNRNYNDGPQRNYYLATINYFRDAGIFTLEFSPADNVSQQAVEMLFNLVKNAFFSKNLFLQLNNQAFLTYEKWSIPVIRINELFANQKLQIIQKGCVAGKLIVVKADSLKYLGDVRNCILLIQGNSNDIPLCRGIITTSFQTPLSHISILSQNRKTPLIALKDAEMNKYVYPYINRSVVFNVLQDTFKLKLDSLADKPDSSATQVRIKLRLDTITTDVVSLEKLKMKNVCTYGAKAVNLAQLQHIKYKGKSIHTPEGAFAIPMFYYFQHLKRNGIDTLIVQFLSDYASMDKTNIRNGLANIRNAVLNSKINADLLKVVNRNIALYGNSERYRFRSSSNAEDLEGFNGAGLYTSETGTAGNKSVEKAIKKVWASVWSERAFDERCNAGIDHITSGMAILAHRSFPNEYANGVAITRNLYRDFDFGFVINIQAGDNSLVKPSVNETCEQLISYFNTTDPFFNEKDAVEYLSFSSLNNNQPLFTKEEIFELTQQLDKIKKRFYRKLKAWKNTAYKDFAMDIEFKAEIVNGEKIFYFKQARLFK